MHGVLRVSDLPHSDKIKYLNAEDATVAHVVSIREEAPTAAETEVAAANAAIAASAAEPEVAKKGKPEDAAKTAELAPRSPRPRSKPWPKQVSSTTPASQQHLLGCPELRNVAARFWSSGWAIPAWSICGLRITRGSWPLTASPSKRALWSRTGAAGP